MLGTHFGRISNRRPGRRTAWARWAVGACLLLAVGGVGGARAPPSCFAKEATNPGSLIGTPGDDVLIGTSGDNTIRGRGGNDRLLGGPGNDRIDGGPGNDLITGDWGPADQFAGQANFADNGGDDLLLGGPGDDGFTADHVRIDAGEISGDGGNDTIEGGRGEDTIFGDSQGGAVTGRRAGSRAPEPGPAGHAGSEGAEATPVAAVSTASPCRRCCMVVTEPIAGERHLQSRVMRTPAGTSNR